MQYIERATVGIDTANGEIRVRDDRGQQHVIKIDRDRPVLVNVATKEEDR